MEENLLAVAEEEEEVLAVNELLLSETLFAEGYNAVFAKHAQKTMYFCGLAFLVGGLMLCALQVAKGDVPILGVPTVVIGLFVLLWAYRLPKSDCKKKYKQLSKLGEDALRRKVTFTDTGLHVSVNGRNSADIDYDDVWDVKETEHLYVLCCANRVGVLLDKNGFVEGSDEVVTKLKK